MNLPFTTYHNGKYNFFVEKILSSFPETRKHDVLKFQKLYYQKFPEVLAFENYHFKPKLHTLRFDEADRWQPGRVIHFYIYNRTKRMFNFAPLATCVSTQLVRIIAIEQKVYIQEPHGYRQLTNKEVEALAVNDGFENTNDFYNYFLNHHSNIKLIHWTNLKY